MQDLLGFDAQHLLGGFIDGGDHPVRIQGDHPGGDTFKDKLYIVPFFFNFDVLFF